MTETEQVIREQQQRSVMEEKKAFLKRRLKVLFLWDENGYNSFFRISHILWQNMLQRHIFQKQNQNLIRQEKT